MLSNLPFEAQLLVLRGAVLLLLYLFLSLVVLVLAGDLRRAARKPAPPERSALGYLVLVDPGPTGLEPGTRFPLSTVSSLGRSLRNTVSLDDDFLSGEHALLSWRDQNWWLQDLDSTNGTCLNGVRIDQAVPLAPGDLIEIGRLVLRLER
ncbi:MAG: FHA domain-containing protein [Chloroflexia bacterium]|nr:FHA domain-containing protein [Chloroflexia bacterium]